MRIASKKEVLDLMEDLTPWDREELIDSLSTDCKNLTEEQILDKFGIDPIMYVTAGECANHFGNEILDSFADYELVDELQERSDGIPTREIISMLVIQLRKKKALEERGIIDCDLFAESDIEKLEDIVKELRGNK